MPVHTSLRQQMAMSQRLVTTTGEIFHGLSFRSIGSSMRYITLHEHQHSTAAAGGSKQQKNKKPEAITGTKMNIFGSDICSQDFILNKIETVQVSPSVVDLEVDEIVAMEDSKIFNALSTLFLQKDRLWRRIKFRDSFDKPKDFQDYLDGRKSLLERISNSSDLPISFQVKLNFARGEHQREDYSDFFVKLQENQHDVSRLVLSGDMAGRDPCDSKTWEALVDFVSNKRNSRHGIKFWQRVSLNLFYYQDDDVKNKFYNESWKHEMLPIAIASLKKGMRCRSFHGAGSKHSMMKKRPGVKRSKSAKTSTPDYRWDGVRQFKSVKTSGPDYRWELHAMTTATKETTSDP